RRKPPIAAIRSSTGVSASAQSGAISPRSTSPFSAPMGATVARLPAGGRPGACQGEGMARARRATVDDLRRLARPMPGVTIWHGPMGNDVYQVSRRSFVFFRNPRPDAVDPETGERYDDVVVLWVGSEIDKQALVADESTPFFTTAHFDGHPSVLLR